LRFPLINGNGSAEARIVLWSQQNGSPDTLVPEGISEPINWTERNEKWISFPFSNPIPIDPTVPLWAALIVSRGEVIWKLASSLPDDYYPIRLGSPDGPWRALPSLFDKSSEIGAVSGRLHIIGLPEEYAPIAPLLLSIDKSKTVFSVTPSEQQTRLLINVETPGDDSTEKSDKANTQTNILSVTSRGEGSVTLSEVDVITGGNP
jgi:hypothetical protein